MKTETFINKAKRVHGDKYDYSKLVYNEYGKDVCVICPEHGEFHISPTDLLKGRGCPECAKRDSMDNGNDKLFDVPQKKWLTKQECVGVIGVTVNTLDAWIREGFLTYRIFNKTVRINRASFEYFINEVWEIHEANKSMKSDLTRQREAMVKEIELYKGRTNLTRWFVGRHGIEMNKALVNAALMTLPKEANPRTVDIASSLLNGEDIEKVANHYGMTVANVRLLMLALFKRFSEDNCQSYKNLKEELEKKNQLLDKQREHISALMVELKKAGKKKGASSDRSYLKEVVTNVNTRTESLNLSVRTVNSLRINGITSLSQLIDIKQSKLSGMPRMGRRAISEIDHEMRRLGISFKPED